MAQPPAAGGGDLSARLAQLTPAQRALLERKLRGLAGTAPPPSDRIPRRAPGPAPLTPAQELLWTLDQAMPGVVAYNVPRVLRIEGALDVDALQRAIDALVVRHEILRARFVTTPDGPRQDPAPPASVPLALVDLRALPDAERAAESERVITAGARHAFDLARDVLLRATVVREGDARWRVLLLTHHIACDEASRDVTFRELAALYAAAREGRDAALPPTSIQFADYAAWQRDALASGELVPHVAYWRERLRGLPALDLPTDRPRSGAPAFTGVRRRVLLPPGALELARRVSREHGTTLYVTLLAAVSALLHRYTGADDVGVASPVTGRGMPELEGLIGYFPNTLVMRTAVDGARPFAALLRATRETVLAAFEHRDVPLEAALDGSGAAAVTPVCFALQGAAPAAVELAGLAVEPELTDFGTAKFELLLSAAEREDGLLLGIEARLDLFDAETAERTLTHLATLLDAALANPETPVDALPLLPPNERARVLTTWNDTARPYPEGETLVSLLAEQAARTPNAPAVADERRTLTYAALDARATALAHRLRALGAGAGALVGVCAERSVELVVALVAVLKAGAAYVPLDPEYPRDRLAFMLDDAGAKVLLAPSGLASTLPPNDATTVALDDVADAPLADTPLADNPPLPVPAPHDPAYMIYTSGSTGRPKGALNAHRGVVNRLCWMQDEYALTPRDVVLQKTPFSFDVSVWELFWPLMTGAKLVMAPPGGHRDPAYLGDVIARERVTVCHFVPSMLRAFLGDADPARCASLRDVMASGEALAPDLVAAFNRVLAGARLHNLYGPTECAVDVTYWPCPRGAEPPAVVPIGRPVANTRVYVLDARGEPTPIGVPGELFIAGVQVGLGYHGRPELTAERFVADPFADVPNERMYRTGDLARWRADGTLEYLGRLDFQVKLRGFRIELGEIETALAQHAHVQSAVVVARDDGRGDACLVAYVVPRALPGAAADGFADETVAAWRAHLGATLPEYMVPAVFVRLDALPLTPSGKVDRRALPETSTERATRPYVAPRTESERALAAVWADVLKAARVGAEDGFLALGGHSLSAMRVVGRVRSDLGVVLPLAALLRGDTLGQLAARLDELRASPAASPDEPEDEFALAPVGRDAFRRAGPANGGRS